MDFIINIIYFYSLLLHSIGVIITWYYSGNFCALCNESKCHSPFLYLVSPYSICTITWWSKHFCLGSVLSFRLGSEYSICLSLLCFCLLVVYSSVKRDTLSKDSNTVEGPLLLHKWVGDTNTNITFYPWPVCIPIWISHVILISCHIFPPWGGG